MSTLLIYIIIIASVVMLLIGFISSAREFKKMEKHPEDYRHRFPLMEDPEKLKQ